MSSTLHTRRRASVPAHRCQVCGGEGFCDLRPLPNGRMACAPCRSVAAQRAAAVAAAAKDRPPS